MTTCPQCSAENPPEAATCSRCGHALRPPEAQGQAELPSWLQQLNPDAAAPSQAAAKPVAPPAAPPAPPAAAAPGPVAARQAAAPPPTERVVEQRAAAPASRPAGQAESGALIGEEDLPAWLRAWEANASTAKQSAASDADNQEWMLGSEPAAAPETAGHEGIASLETVAQTWQKPAQPVVRPRSSAAEVFARVAESEPAPPAAASAAPARASTWRAPVEPEPEPRPVAPEPFVPQPMPRPAAAPARVSRRAASRRRRGLTPATLVLIVAAIFFLIALGFFLFTVGPFH